ncbi:MAG: bacteriorhodopsin [Alphaproteobacteria bacterium]|jgi:bacteriorhodopsin|nr:bacteriorhodopsin [Alphaproteobacteria bacterium]
MPLDVATFNIIANAFSFAIAAFAASTIFFFFMRQHVAPAYRMALLLSGLVTFIALYHYVRIHESWHDAYAITEAGLQATAIPFNDAYRYVDWLLTVPLLLIELILVMRLPQGEGRSLMIKLGVAAAVMIILGYPGEVATDDATRWTFWVLSMIPFLYIVYTLVIGLTKAIGRQPESARGLVSAARWLTVVVWLFYPIVFLFPMLGLTGAGAELATQIGYSAADLLAKAVFGLLIAAVAYAKSRDEAGFTMGDSEQTWARREAAQ